MTAGPEKAGILVVDDLPGNLIVYKTVLEELGQDLILVQSGSDALKEVLRRDFAVVILDVNMPELDGFETAAMIRARRRSAHVPIIFVTAFIDEPRASEGYSLGAVDFIRSPVVPSILRSKVKVFVDLFLLTVRVRRQGEEQAALAEEQARRAAAEESNRRLSFLAEAGAVIGGSLDFSATSRDVARLAVPFLAERAAVVLTGPVGGRETVVLATAGGTGVAVMAGAGRDGLPEEMARRLDDGFDAVPAGSDASGGPDTKESPIVLAVPLETRGHRFGALVLSRLSSGRVFAPADRYLVQAYAGRSASALLNSRLFQDVLLANRRKEEFLPMLAHELRNPLAPIRNAVEILGLMKIQDPGARRSIEIIDRQAVHLARLVDDLLDATRIAQGKILLRKEVCDLARIVRQSAEDHRPDLAASGIRLELEDLGRPLWVDGDPTRLAQIVGNLLHNAHKFTDPGGVVTLGARAVAETGEVWVRDTGIGIDGALLPHVFEVFAQGDQSLERSHGGLGLGLALVKGLVELHGGGITAASDGPGTGSRFTVRLPLVAGPKTAEPAPQETAAARDRYRILVVEDNPDAAESTRELLAMMGHEVEIAGDGPSGLDATKAFRPQVILCDIGLPGGINGYDLARLIRQDASLHGIYLIALTGYGREEDLRRAQEAGFDRHLTKPVDGSVLRRALASLPARV